MHHRPGIWLVAALLLSAQWNHAAPPPWWPEPSRIPSRIPQARIPVPPPSSSSFGKRSAFIWL